MTIGSDIDRLMRRLHRDTLGDYTVGHEQFVPIDEAAERMNTTPKHVIAAVKAGALRAVRVYDVLMVEPAITNWRE